VKLFNTQRSRHIRKHAEKVPGRQHEGSTGHFKNTCQGHACFSSQHRPCPLLVQSNSIFLFLAAAMPFIIFKYQTGPVPFLIKTQVFSDSSAGHFQCIYYLESGVWSQLCFIRNPGLKTQVYPSWLVRNRLKKTHQVRQQPEC